MQDNHPIKYQSSQMPQASNNKFEMLQQQQQQIYKAFQLQNFYQNKKLNIQKLKNQIQKFKSNRKNINSNARSRNTNLMPINPKNIKRQIIGLISQFQTPTQNLKATYYNNKSFDQNYTNDHRNQYIKQVNNQYQQKKNRNNSFYNNQNKLQSLAVPHIKIQNKYKQRNNNPIFNQFNYQNAVLVQPKPTTPIMNNNTRTNFRQSKYLPNNHQNKPISREKHIRSDFQTYNFKSNAHNPQLNKLNDKMMHSRVPIKNQIKRQKTEQQKQIITKAKPKTYHFKIQPVSSVGSQSYQQQNQKISRQSKQRYTHTKNNNRNTQKSVYGSQKDTQISSSHFRNQFNYNKRIKIDSKQQLQRLQLLICQLWNLYELLTFLMQHAIDYPFSQQNYLQTYVKQVCSQRFEHIRTLLSQFNNKRLNKIIRLAKLLQNVSIIYLVIELTKKKPIKQSHIVNFIGYCTSNIIFIIKILYLLHDIQIFPKNQTIRHNQQVQNKKQLSPQKNKSYTSLHSKQSPEQKRNILYKNNKNYHNNFNKNNNQIIPKNLNDEAPTIDRNQINNQINSINKNQIQLNSKIEYQTQKYIYSTNTKNIFSIIRRFQLDSYKQQLNSLLDVIIRMEHNCQIINIVQIKLCMQTQKDVQNIITDFLKDALRQQEAYNRRKYQDQQSYQNFTKTYYDSAHYIFQYLAYYIAKKQFYGILPALQVAPTPYLNLKFPHTVIIEPYEVLVYQKNKNILIRAYSEFFIQSLSKCCNIVFWSDMMPQQIDPILQLFPKKDNIYYLYKYHCIYDDNTRTFVKNLDRVGGRIDSTIIIDRSQGNFVNHRLNGFQFVWLGQKRDTKLQNLYKILQPIFSKNHSLRKSLSQIRPQIVSLNVKNKKTYNNKPFLRHHKFERIQDQQYTFQRNKNINSRQSQYYNNNNFDNKYHQNNSRQYSRNEYQRQQMERSYNRQNKRRNNELQTYNQRFYQNQLQQEEQHMQLPMQIAKNQVYNSNNENSHQLSNLSIFH